MCESADMAAAPREKALYFAKLVAQAERHDELAEHLDAIEKLGSSAEERNLLSVGCDNTAGCRRSARRCPADVEQREWEKGGAESARFAREYCANVENQLDSICRSATTLLERTQPTRALTNEARVFYRKMQAENCRLVAELAGVEAKGKAVQSAAKAHDEALLSAERSPPKIHPVSHSLAPSHSIFQAEVPGNPRVACETAPKSLRVKGPWGRVGGGVSPRGKGAAAAAVAQRLCDLLLQFPTAAAAGVPWRVLAETYSEAYQEDLDVQGLGFPCASAAAEGLLAGVMRKSGGVSRPQVKDGESDEEFLVAVDDSVALTPLPRYAVSWPSLYSSLCQLVESCGEAEEASPKDASGRTRPTKSLLLSQVMPLLKGEASATLAPPAEPVGKLLLSQLRSVSLDDQGLGFLDVSGVSRRLRKIGQLVQAVLRWRYQRVEWRRENGLTATALDRALEPQLELAFSRQKNNLMLRLVEGEGIPAECPRYYRDQPRHAEAADAGTRALGQRSAARKRCRSLPVSQQLRHAILPSVGGLSQGTPFQARGSLAADGLTEPRCAERTSCTTGPEAPPPAASGSGVRAPATAVKTEAESSGTCSGSSCQSTACGRSSERSPSRRRRSRSPSCHSRARSLPDSPQLDCCGEPLRSHSEPPQPCAAASPNVFDDPFEPPPQAVWSQREWCAAGAVPPAPMQFTAAPTLHAVMPAIPLSLCMCLHAAVPAVPLASSRAREGRGGRARSTERSPRSPEEQRCRSEPPVPRDADLFDNPFEPPPQRWLL